MQLANKYVMVEREKREKKQTVTSCTVDSPVDSSATRRKIQASLVVALKMVRSAYFKVS